MDGLKLWGVPAGDGAEGRREGRGWAFLLWRPGQCRATQLVIYKNSRINSSETIYWHHLIWSCSLMVVIIIYSLTNQLKFFLNYQYWIFFVFAQTGRTWKNCFQISGLFEVREKCEGWATDTSSKTQGMKNLENCNLDHIWSIISQKWHKSLQISYFFNSSLMWLHLFIDFSRKSWVFRIFTWDSIYSYFKFSLTYGALTSCVLLLLIE